MIPWRPALYFFRSMPAFDEQALLDKLRRIEALHAGATTAGERDAAAEAIRRIQERITGLEREDPPIEYRFGMSDAWSRRLFMALARRYGLKPYRYSRQRYTTVMLRVSRRFVEETLWPECHELDRALHDALHEATEQAVGPHPRRPERGRGETRAGAARPGGAIRGLDGG